MCKFIVDLPGLSRRPTLTTDDVTAILPLHGVRTSLSVGVSGIGTAITPLYKVSYGPRIMLAVHTQE